mmetsp:Transcript_10857/g.35990  ORF Transcript_10857/g.35990 Transcript_10857/m.35990 type:complete len:327 (-) Transcript_10857:227-1207(-)
MLVGRVDGVEDGPGPPRPGLDGVGRHDEFVYDVAFSLRDDEAEGRDARGGDVELGDVDVAVAEVEGAPRRGRRGGGPLELAGGRQHEVARVPPLQVGRLLHEPAGEDLPGLPRGLRGGGLVTRRGAARVVVLAGGAALAAAKAAAKAAAVEGKVSAAVAFVRGGPRGRGGTLRDGDFDEVFPSEAELAEGELGGDAEDRMGRRRDEAREDGAHRRGHLGRVPPGGQGRGLDDLAEEPRPEEAEGQLPLDEDPRHRQRHAPRRTADGHRRTVEHRIDRHQQRQQVQRYRHRRQRPAQRREVVLRITLRDGLRLDVQRIQRRLREERR